MNAIKDDRLRFYLQHQEQIDEWAALRGEASATLDQWLRAQAETLEGLAADLNASLSRPRANEKWPAFYLHQRSWRSVPGQPRVTIGIQWESKKVLLTGPTTPYVGVCWPERKEKPESYRHFRELTETIRKERKDRATQGWAAFRHLSAEGAYWEDLGPYGELVERELRAAWQDYLPAIEEALRLG